MRRILALTAILFGLTFAQGQPQPSRVYTSPMLPPQDALDRLNLQTVWRQILPIEGRRDGIATIQHLGDQLFVQVRDGTVYAINAETGAIQWATQPAVPYPAVPRRLGYDGEQVFFIDVDRIITLERASGRKRWEFQLPDIPASPPMAGELLFYVPLVNGRLLTYALPQAAVRFKEADKATKDKARAAVEELRTQLKQSAPASTTVIDPRSIGTADAGRGRLATTSGLTNRTSTSTSAALEGRGEIRRYVTGREKSAPDRPVLIGAQAPGFRVDHPVNISPLGALISGNGTEMLFLRRDPQNPVFRYSSQTPMTLPPVVFGPTAYLSTQGGIVESINLVAGLTNWRFAAGSVITDLPMATPDSVYVPTRRTGIIRVDPARGLATWNQPEAVRMIASNEKFVYAADRTGQLLVLNRLNGFVLSRFDLSAYNVPIVNTLSDRLYFAANDGSIICLRDQGHVGPMMIAPGPAAKPLPAKAKVEQDDRPKVEIDEKPAEKAKAKEGAKDKPDMEKER